MFFDITPRDVHSVLKLLESYDCTCVDVPTRDGEDKVISGLKINDVKLELTRAMDIQYKFQEVWVPRTPPPKCRDYVIAMAFRLGLHWYELPSTNHLWLCIGLERDPANRETGTFVLVASRPSTKTAPSGVMVICAIWVAS